MARIPRVILPDYPHHIIQRGNRRQNTFFHSSDYEKYLILLKKSCVKENVDILAYCLMTNHVHLILVPRKKSNLSKAIGETHKHYTHRINERYNWIGYLWQGRFLSFPMDENHLLQAAAYIELNPVKANMVKNPWDYKYSSVHAHLSGKDKLGIVNTQILLDLVDGDWKTYLQQKTQNLVLKDDIADSKKDKYFKWAEKNRNIA